VTDPLGLWWWDGDWVQYGVGGLLGVYGSEPQKEGLKGAHDGLIVTTNSAARNLTGGAVGKTREELAKDGELFDPDNEMLKVSDAAGQVIGEATKLMIFSGLAELAECGTAAGDVLKAALELKAEYDKINSVIDAGQTVVELAELIEKGDYEGAAKLAAERGAEFILQRLVAKVTDKIAKKIKCFVEGTVVLTSSGAVPIEDVGVGDRVLTGTPSDETGETEVDPASWRVYTIEVEAGTARTGQIKLLRPAAWLAENEVGVDKAGSVWVNLNIPGWGLDGLARVLAIEPCPDIKPGPGRVVLMKSITLYRGEMAKVQFEGFATPLEGTSSHPVFSLDEGDFVPLGSLEPCDRVRTADGWAVVESMARWWGETTVYNLEVEGEHQYLAGDARVVSHNDNAAGGANCKVYRGLREGEDPAKGITARNPDANATPAQHVNGKRESQWISTTADEEIAKKKYGKHGVVEIDTSKTNTEVVDCRNGVPGSRSRRVNNYARKDKEILIRGHVPPDAVRRVH
jgi:hypothetical protein